ncbi:MAG: hypothetical protein AAF658_15895, partial [Myxococcota bacterium]
MTRTPRTANSAPRAWTLGLDKGSTQPASKPEQATQRRTLAPELPRGLAKLTELLAASPSGVDQRTTVMGAARLRETNAVDPATQPGRVGAQLTPRLRGYTLGCIVLGRCPEALAHALDRRRVESNGLNRAIQLRCSGFPAASDSGRIAHRLSALIDLMDTELGALDADGRSALSELQALEPSSIRGYTPPRSTRDGSVENICFELLELSRPGLARELALHHPQIAKAHELPSTRELAQECAKDFGAFAGDFNVFTCMHVMGRTPGFLEILRDDLGMCPKDYLGYSVAYSDSAVSRGRSSIDGFETRAYGHARLPYVERCKQALREGLLEMASRSLENGKPILIVDDTGYAAEVATELGIAERCHIVGWTKRTSWLFDEGHTPECAFLRAGESAPKVEWEPPLLAPG